MSSAITAGQQGVGVRAGSACGCADQRYSAPRTLTSHAHRRPAAVSHAHRQQHAAVVCAAGRGGGGSNHKGSNSRRGERKAFSSSSSDPVCNELKYLAQEFGPKALTVADSLASSRKGSSSKRTVKAPPSRPASQSPVLMLIALQVVAFLYLLATYGSSIPGPSQLPLCLQLGAKSFQWWQCISATFVHFDFTHLAETVFMTYIWGQLCLEKMGAWGLVTVAGLSVAGACALAYLLFPTTFPTKVTSAVALAPAAWLGLFTAGLFWPRILRKPAEVACLAPFVCIAATQRFSHLAPLLVVEGIRVGHLVHAAGAVLAATLVVAVFKVVGATRAWMERLDEEKRRKSREA